LRNNRLSFTSTAGTSTIAALLV